MSATGEDIFWSHQHDVLDPESALTDHLRINSGSEDDALFAYTHKGSLRLSWNGWQRHASQVGFSHYKDTEFVSGQYSNTSCAGVPFDVVKVMYGQAMRFVYICASMHKSSRLTCKLHEKFVHYSHAPQPDK